MLMHIAVLLILRFSHRCMTSYFSMVTLSARMSSTTWTSHFSVVTLGARILSITWTSHFSVVTLGLGSPPLHGPHISHWLHWVRGCPPLHGPHISQWLHWLLGSMWQPKCQRPVRACSLLLQSHKFHAKSWTFYNSPLILWQTIVLPTLIGGHFIAGLFYVGTFCKSIGTCRYFLWNYRNQILRTGASSTCFLQIITVPLS